MTICRHINYRWNFNSHVYILASESSTEFWTDKMKCSIIDANLFPIEIMEMYKLVKETDVEIKDNNLVTPMLLREEDSRQDTNQSSSSSRHTEVNQDDTSVSTRTTKTVKQLSDQKFQLKFNLWLVNKNGDYKDEETRKTVTNWCNNMREQNVLRQREGAVTTLTDERYELLLKHGFDFKPQENRWATKLELFKVNKNDPTLKQWIREQRHLFLGKELNEVQQYRYDLLKKAGYVVEEPTEKVSLEVQLTAIAEYLVTNNTTTIHQSVIGKLPCGSEFNIGMKYSKVKQLHEKVIAKVHDGTAKKEHFDKLELT